MHRMLAAGLRNIRPARTSTIIVENIVKARRRISNCRSIISSILQRNLYIEMKWTLAARDKFMSIIWPFELSELSRPALQNNQSIHEK